MKNQSRFYNIALVFVLALAHGVWIGAGWHAASETSSDPTSALVAHCACAKTASQPGCTVISEVRNADTCSICQLSTLLPDVPTPHLQLAPEPRIIQDAPLPHVQHQYSSCQDRLPPQRGPPSVI